MSKCVADAAVSFLEPLIFKLRSVTELWFRRTKYRSLSGVDVGSDARDVDIPLFVLLRVKYLYVASAWTCVNDLLR